MIHCLLKKLIENRLQRIFFLILYLVSKKRKPSDAEILVVLKYLTKLLIQHQDCGLKIIFINIRR
jgi:hypothetical protein